VCEFLAFKPVNEKKPVFGKIAVLDAAAFIHRADLSGFDKVYTTFGVIEELQDDVSLWMFEAMKSSKKLEVISPTEESIKKVGDATKKLGENLNLSKTDISVLALSLDLIAKHEDVVLLVDDYGVQNIASFMGIPFQPIRFPGIRERFKWGWKCESCGNTYSVKEEETCPECGGTLKRYVKKRTTP